MSGIDSSVPRVLVYFIQIETGPIKIGKTVTPLERRIKAILTGCPYDPVVLTTLPNMPDATERLIHKRFASSRLRREWFNPDPDLLAFVASLADPSVVAALEAEGVREYYRTDMKGAGFFARQQHRHKLKMVRKVKRGLDAGLPLGKACEAAGLNRGSFYNYRSFYEAEYGPLNLRAGRPPSKP